MNLILVELNELNFKYAKKYFNNLKLNSLKKIHDKLIDTASESDQNLLEPWIQWHSIHTGLKAKEHGIFRLGDAINSNNKQIFEILEDKKFKVGSISAMNTSNKLKNPSYFIPDPWTDTKSDDSYFSKIITSVLKDTVNNNSSGKFKKKNYFYLILIFLKFVRLTKYLSFIKIFLSSFFGKWRKALFLDLLIHEIHLHMLNKNNPNFSCIFFNACAHIQHHYLLNSLANSTKLKNPKNILNNKHDPFKETLLVYDKILEDYINSEKNVIIATGLTQRIISKPSYYYRLIDHVKFLNQINLKFLKVEPRMSRDFLIHFENNIHRDAAFEDLKKIKLNDKELLFGILDKREKSIFASLTYSKEITKNDIINYKDMTIRAIKAVTFVAIKNGEHDQRGFLYARGEISKQFENINEIKITEIKSKIEKFFFNLKE